MPAAEQPPAGPPPTGGNAPGSAHAVAQQAYVDHETETLHIDAGASAGAGLDGAEVNGTAGVTMTPEEAMKLMARANAKAGTNGVGLTVNGQGTYQQDGVTVGVGGGAALTPDGMTGHGAAQLGLTNDALRAQMEAAAKFGPGGPDVDISASGTYQNGPLTVEAGAAANNVVTDPDINARIRSEMRAPSGLSVANETAMQHMTDDERRAFSTQFSGNIPVAPGTAIQPSVSMDVDKNGPRFGVGVGVSQQVGPLNVTPRLDLNNIGPNSTPTLDPSIKVQGPLPGEPAPAPKVDPPAGPPSF